MFSTSYLHQRPTGARRSVIENLNWQFNAMDSLQNKVLASMVELGKHYPEFAKNQRVPNIGLVGTHVFNVFI